MKDQSMKDTFLEMRASGLSFEKIALSLNVSKQTLINWSKQLKIELDNAHAIARDNHLRRLELHETARLELLGLILTKTKTELGARDFSEMPTEKLVDIILKATKATGSIDSRLILRESQTVDPADIFLPTLVENQWEA